MINNRFQKLMNIKDLLEVLLFSFLDQFNFIMFYNTHQLELELVQEQGISIHKKDVQPIYIPDIWYKLIY